MRMLCWQYFLSSNRTNDDLGGGLLQITFIKRLIEWHYIVKKKYKHVERWSNFPSFIVELCNYCSTFSVSPKLQWRLGEIWWFGISLGRNKRQTWGFRKRQTAHERTNHTTEREIKPKHSLLKPDSPISQHPSAQAVSTYCLLGCLTDSLVHWLKPRLGVTWSEITRFRLSGSHCRYSMSDIYC